jgi:hypothetical protein
MNLPLTHYLSTHNRYRRSTGIVTFVAGAAAVPASAWAVQEAVFSLLGLTFVTMGLYDLYTSDFYRVVRPAGFTVAGVGVVLVSLNVIRFWELIVLWPLAFVLFGTISLLTGILADWNENVTQS